MKVGRALEDSVRLSATIFGAKRAKGFSLLSFGQTTEIILYFCIEMKKTSHTKKKLIKSKREKKEFYKKYFESFSGFLKGNGDVLAELMKEKKIEREL